jgi:uncharacterized phage protein gp47/JayE
VTFTPRGYEEIVRDMLTTLTGGTVREVVPAPPPESLVVPQKLLRRPVRRISHLAGRIATSAAADAPQVDYRFTAQDFELIAASGTVGDEDTIRFRPEGRRPAPGSWLEVNYYPLHTDPVPLTDVNVGSVVRTVMETVAREMALVQQQLQRIYDSAFVDTAESGALDRVVALVGVSRIRAGHPVTTVRFSRQPGTAGQITVPASTALTDGDGNRYRTLTMLVMEPNETTGEVLAAGDTPGTPEVAELTLDRLEVLIAGISSVTNPQPARRLATAEEDDVLRRRARGALAGSVRGTLSALEFGLRSIDGVKDLTLTEEPNGVPGEVRITIAYREPTAELRATVDRTIRELRPAGIRVVLGDAARRRVGARAELTLAGSGLAAADTATLVADVQQRLADLLDRTAPGGKVRRSQLGSVAMTDPRVIDARIVLIPDGGSETEELRLADGETLEVVLPIAVTTQAEQAGTSIASSATVSATLPLHLAPAVTELEATQAMTLALSAHLASRSPSAPLTVDGVVAALRDDTRFALVRAEVLLTVETADGRFLQLTDGTGTYAPTVSETLQRGAMAVDIREGNA